MQHLKLNITHNLDQRGIKDSWGECLRSIGLSLPCSTNHVEINDVYVCIYNSLWGRGEGGSMLCMSYHLLIRTTLLWDGLFSHYRASCSYNIMHKNLFISHIFVFRSFCSKIHNWCYWSLVTTIHKPCTGWSWILRLEGIFICCFIWCHQAFKCATVIWCGAK